MGSRPKSLGGGLEIAAACDLRLASAKSRFGIPVSRIGVVMAHAELQALRRLVGHARALEILLTGEVFATAEAQALGLVNRSSPLSEEETNEAYEFAGTSDYAEGIAAFLEKRPPRFEGWWSKRPTRPRVSCRRSACPSSFRAPRARWDVPRRSSANTPARVLAESGFRAAEIDRLLSERAILEARNTS